MFLMTVLKGDEHFQDGIHHLSLHFNQSQHQAFSAASPCAIFD
jgi:hypothetical protein